MKAYSLPAVTKTMRVGLKKAKTKLPWTGNNKHQNTLIALFGNKVVEEIETLLGKQLKTKAEVAGATIKLTTLLDVAAEWLKKGKAETVKGYKAVLLDSGFTVYKNDVVAVETKTDDIVFLKKGKVAGADLMTFVTNANALMEETLKAKTDKYDELVFPKTDFDEEVDMSKVLGMNTGSYAVVEASQKVKFSMDEVGAKVKVEVKMTMLKSAKPRPPKNPKRFVIDGPFTVMMLKKGTTVPYFAANVTAKQLQKATK